MASGDLFAGWCGTVTTVLVAIATLALLAAVYFVRRQLSYFQRLGIKCVPSSFPFGSYADMFLSRKYVSDVVEDIYNRGKGEKYIGSYITLKPVLVLRDVDLIKNVLVKDFANFADRGTYTNEEVDPCSVHLFSIEGEKWRVLRHKMSPTFTSGKMKVMYKTMAMCNKQLLRYVEGQVDAKDTFNVTTMIKRYGLNVIANTAFAIEGSTMEEDNEFARMVFKFHELTVVQMMRVTLPLICKELAQLLRMRITPKEVGDYLCKIVKEIVTYRETTKTRRNDFMQMMIDLNNTTNEDEQVLEGGKILSMNDMIAQAFIFIIAGYETTSSNMAFLLYELAKNQDVQEKLIQEFDEAGDNIDDITYEKIMGLPYVDMVLDEALRKHPPVGFLQRVAEKDYPLPGGKTLEAGTMVFIPVKALQWDPQYYPDPEKFNPERFNKDSSEQSIVPFTHLPFGDGPRFCIGMRFARLQVKMALFTLLSKFRLEIAETTRDPPVIEPKAFTQQPLGGSMNLRFVRRK